MKDLILQFFLLILGVLFNLAPNTIFKYSKLCKTLFKKSVEFFQRKKSTQSYCSYFLYYCH